MSTIEKKTPALRNVKSWFGYSSSAFWAWRWLGFGSFEALKNIDITVGKQEVVVVIRLGQIDAYTLYQSA